MEGFIRPALMKAADDVQKVAGKGAVVMVLVSFPSSTGVVFEGESRGDKVIMLGVLDVMRHAIAQEILEGPNTDSYKLRGQKTHYHPCKTCGTMVPCLGVTCAGDPKARTYCVGCPQ